MKIKDSDTIKVNNQNQNKRKPNIKQTYILHKYQGFHNIIGFNYSKIDDLMIYCIIMSGCNH